MFRETPLPLSPESQAFYEAWFEQHYSEQPDELQVLEQIWDLDQRLMEFLAPAFSARGAPARDVLRVMRALLLLVIKNVRSENFLVDQELKTNVLYRWFVRLAWDEPVTAAFRLRMVRLRARLMKRLGPERQQAFLAQTVELAQRYALRARATPAPSVPATPTSVPPRSLPSREPIAAATVIGVDPGRVTFDLTPVKGRARIRSSRDQPDRTMKLPTSAGDPDCYWISKRRPGGRTDVTLGYEVGLFSDWVGGLITGVVVRQRGQENELQFNHWVDQYQRAWQLGPGELTVSTDREFFTGEILRHGERQQQTLLIPSVTIRPRQGKLDQSYFTYLPDEDLWVCHEGVELKRTGYDAQKTGARYKAPASACAQCPTAGLCKSGKGPRRLFRSDLAAEFERARQRERTPECARARRAQRVMAEGSFAHGNCLHGLDRARYYGDDQMQLQGSLTAWAMNLKKAGRWALAQSAAGLAAAA
jgi:hypothetical protein